MPPIPLPDFPGLENVSVMLTGASDGIGKQAAKILSSRVGQLVLHGRNPGKLQAVAESLMPQARAEICTEIADLSSLAETRSLAERVAQKYPRLNLLINNAGVMMDRELKTPDGLELSFMVNYLAPFTLSLSLSPHLVRNAPSRLVLLGSLSHRLVRLRPDNLQGWGGKINFMRYARNKLALTSFGRHFGRTLSATGLSLVIVHPGVVPTTKVYDVPLLKPFGQTPYQAALALLSAALDPLYANFKGVYFEGQQVSNPSKQARDESFGEMLWQESLKLSGLEGWQL